MIEKEGKGEERRLTWENVKRCEKGWGKKEKDH